MARTPSTMLPIGTIAPDFRLPNTEGDIVDLESLKGRPGLVVMFISNHCPFVVHLKDELTQFGHDYGATFSIVAIASNDLSTHPQDGPEHTAADKAKYGDPFDYCFDETQEVAKAYEAACTPTFTFSMLSKACVSWTI